MHPHPRFRWDDEGAIRAFVADRSFGALILAAPQGALVAQVPLVWMGEGLIGLHLARGNALVPHLDGARCLLLVQGPDAYVSPDWYGVDDQVPTWNYVSAELEGVAQACDEAGLLRIIDALSSEHERRLAPKPPWTRAKMTPGLVEKMCKGIVGFTIAVDALRGTRKLGQNKADDVRLRAADAMEAAGDPATAGLMREG